ncbi:MAG: uracil-DNA glycosylase [Nitrososphaeria archaeon]|nr:uracil-DNA glycosylase [Nitrosopumilaceae archaeon]NIP10142.1 uracil-DNA glycosylase [Nitrosopumilaceae archaeon]NIP91506.1 uracil-DNA glycosylase [Nitrososphaeria archaeon]NIS95341.1 uracil-DNA glycosylase [Nitrosopumilaceae archaeon]
MMSLEEIRQNVIDCTKCSLAKTRTHSVPGKGNFHSDVIFVGEAPGRNEDLKGEPFVGVAGKKLSLALEEAGITRDEVYITNTVKCRPPNNRVPNNEEKQMCSNYIEKEIEIINPKIICVLGNTAFGSILGGSEITKYRGKVARKGNQLYFITVHPAATIYNQELIQILKQDIKKLFQIIRELKNGKQVIVDIEFTS